MALKVQNTLVVDASELLFFDWEQPSSTRTQSAQVLAGGTEMDSHALVPVSAICDEPFGVHTVAPLGCAAFSLSV